MASFWVLGIFFFSLGGKVGGSLLMETYGKPCDWFIWVNILQYLSECSSRISVRDDFFLWLTGWCLVMSKWAIGWALSTNQLNFMRWCSGFFRGATKQQWQLEDRKKQRSTRKRFHTDFRKEVSGRGTETNDGMENGNSGFKQTISNRNPCILWDSPPKKNQPVQLIGGLCSQQVFFECSGELWQLVLDVVHLLLFFFLAVAPWRLMQCIYFAGQPSEASGGWRLETLLASTM